MSGVCGTPRCNRLWQNCGPRVTVADRYLAKTHHPQLLDDVERREIIVITRHGRAIARIVPEAHLRQAEVDTAIASIKTLRKRTGKITVRGACLGQTRGTQVLMPFVLDASIAACWAFDDEDHPVAAVALERVRTDEARVPSLWWFEVRNTPIVNERRGRLTERDTAAFLRGLVGLPVTLDRSPKEGDTRACPPPPPYSLLRSSGIPRASPKTFSRQGRKWTGKGLETGTGYPFGVNPTERPCARKSASRSFNLLMISSRFIGLLYHKSHLVSTENRLLFCHVNKQP